MDTPQDKKGSRAEKALRTRAALREHARDVFTEVGYADASLDEIVRRAGVTKGALYHHYADKEGLYATVATEMAQELAAALVSALAVAGEAEDTSWARLTAVCEAYLDACLDSEVQRVLVIEAPAILGWQAWCDLDKANSRSVFTDCLTELMRDGRIAEQDPEQLALVIGGALNTAARVILESPTPSVTRSVMGESVRRLLSGLLDE